jgi:hypothetical protein
MKASPRWRITRARYRGNRDLVRLVGPTVESKTTLGVHDLDLMVGIGDFRVTIRSLQCSSMLR